MTGLDFGDCLKSMTESVALYRAIEKEEVVSQLFVNFSGLATKQVSMSEDKQNEILHYLLSQLYHGEIAAYKTVGFLLANNDEKHRNNSLFSQLVDEKFHQEILHLFIQRQFGSVVRPHPSLQTVLDDIYSTTSGKMKSVAVHSLIEGIAYSLLNYLISNSVSENLKIMLTKIKKDEAKHCSMGLDLAGNTFIGDAEVKWVSDILLRIRDCYHDGLKNIFLTDIEKPEFELNFLFMYTFALLKKVGFPIDRIKQNMAAT